MYSTCLSLPAEVDIILLILKSVLRVSPRSAIVASSYARRATVCSYLATVELIHWIQKELVLYCTVLYRYTVAGGTISTVLKNCTIGMYRTY